MTENPDDLAIRIRNWTPAAREGDSKWVPSPGIDVDHRYIFDGRHYSVRAERKIRKRTGAYSQSRRTVIEKRIATMLHARRLWRFALSSRTSVYLHNVDVGMKKENRPPLSQAVVAGQPQFHRNLLLWTSQQQVVSGLGMGTTSSPATTIQPSIEVE
ncbi:uncharacterized protein BT62DRAFT_1007648 [Guyanagaster necrorhizus]|uniref:Uncharacterized protein n=1 Tax=Guyanagaster necrorhizus TaxID=856835 RepID=A0A9P7VQK6_9AGAR|nr:uncharacterized protein BT62DRAFT_1007648 [Guyanagaster necrorhizus MCA 3950]KAG7444630.1 hypothetical protein BT62DRAFT_1007648 [Guyanagaster necrorhizus MCA 3950]